MMNTFCGMNWVIVIFSTLRVEKTVLKNVLRWDHVKVIPGRWERHFGKDQYVVPAGNLPLRPRDCMTIVMHASNNDYKKVTAQPRNHVTWFNDNVKEDLFVQCTNEHVGISGNTKAVYGHWEREPKTVKELCKWFAKDGEGVLLLGNVQVHRPESRCHFERPKTPWLPERDMYLKLGKNRESLWKYLFSNAPKTPKDIGYMHRKVIAIQHLQGYHEAKNCAIEICIARCERLWFNKQEDRQRAKTYADELHAGEHFDVLDSKEDTSVDNMDLPVPGAQEDIQQALDGGEGRRAMEGIETDVVASWKSIRGGEQRSCEQGMQGSGGNEIRGPVGAGNASKNSSKEGTYADTLYDKLRDQNMLAYNTNFYDIESSVSHGQIPWKLPSREVLQEFEGEIRLGNSQQLGHDGGHASMSTAERPFTSSVHSDEQVDKRNDMEKYVGDNDESRRDRVQAEHQSFHPPSQRGDSTVDKESADRFATMESPKVCTWLEPQMATEPMSMQGPELTREESVPQLKGIEDLSENTSDLMLQLLSDGGVLEGGPVGVQRKENVMASMGRDDDELQRTTTVGDKHQQPKRKREDDDDVIDIGTQSREQLGRGEDGEG
ncbi:hypothetical protein CBR_g31322 [Chara braunii]|uniref:Uncharacterized protein n=1 Tax=Chara braunii TaxID=69332 RepID=A0A388LEP1_CHABU|nr:hypothetical protein CBR_g31322 [Chara braunii]|eukprot:GBG80768.1 hypothetical protein CBR_g31322 [Chara braunii]